MSPATPSPPSSLATGPRWTRSGGSWSPHVRTRRRTRALRPPARARAGADRADAVAAGVLDQGTPRSRSAPPPAVSDADLAGGGGGAGGGRGDARTAPPGADSRAAARHRASDAPAFRTAPGGVRVGKTRANEFLHATRR